jgi:hypothetical protein
MRRAGREKAMILVKVTLVVFCCEHTRVWVRLMKLMNLTRRETRGRTETRATYRSRVAVALRS